MIEEHSEKIVWSIFWAVLLLLAYGCSDKHSGIDMELSANRHIEDIEAGWWIKCLKSEGSSQAKYITDQIHQRLIEQANLIDEYRNEKKGYVAIWEYHGKTCSVIIKEEIYLSSDVEERSIWMTYEYTSPGVPWSEVIPSDYQRLKPNRKYENAVTIHSTADKGARLFLFGWGDYCTRISLF